MFLDTDSCLITAQALSMYVGEKSGQVLLSPGSPAMSNWLNSSAIYGLFFKSQGCFEGVPSIVTKSSSTVRPNFFPLTD